jgi:predicted CopG family antitoxin
MATKTITIMEDAYELLKQEKVKNESFSDVIRKVIPKKKSIWDFVGAWSDVPDEKIEELHEFIEKSRHEKSRRTKEILEMMSNDMS